MNGRTLPAVPLWCIKGPHGELMHWTLSVERAGGDCAGLAWAIAARSTGIRRHDLVDLGYSAVPVTLHERAQDLVA